MEVGLHAAPPCLFRDCQSPVDQRQGTVRTPRGGLQLRKHPVKKWRIVLALGHIGLENLSEPACARLWIDQATTRTVDAYLTIASVSASASAASQLCLTSGDLLAITPLQWDKSRLTRDLLRPVLWRRKLPRGLDSVCAIVRAIAGRASHSDPATPQPSSGARAVRLRRRCAPPRLTSWPQPQCDQTACGVGRAGRLSRCCGRDAYHGRAGTARACPKAQRSARALGRIPCYTHRRAPAARFS